MDDNQFFEALNALPRRAVKHADLAADIIPPLIEWLGFDSHDVRFDLAYVYGPSHRIRHADAALLDHDTQDPFLLIEIKERSGRDALERAYHQLKDLLVESGAFAVVVITPTGMSLMVPTLPELSTMDLRFGVLTPANATPFKEQVKAGYATWRLTHRAEQRRQPHAESECQTKLAAIRDASTNDEKKKSLEAFVGFAVERVGYLRVKYSDLRTASSEIDLVVENRGSGKHTMFDEFGRHFLVECKNWAQRVGAKEVRDFVGKLLKTKQRLGILVTRQGVTGGSGEEDALREIQFCYDALNTAVLVLNEQDLEAICAGADLHELLDRKLDKVRFDLA